MTLGLLFLMGYQFWGDPAHEWAGAGMFLLLLLHHALNGSWYRGILRGKYTPARVFQLVIDLLALLSMVSLGSLMGALAYRYGHPLAAGGLTLLTAVGTGYDLFPLLTGAISAGDGAELIPAALWAAVLLAVGELVSWSSMQSYRVM